MSLAGANPEAQVAGVSGLSGKINYFRGNEEQKWITDVPTFRRVSYTGVYPGIDLIYYGKGGQLEYDLVVAPSSENGFQSDYNELYTTGTGKLGQWEGKDFTNRVDWFFEVGFDRHSITSDPLFVNRAGADGILGYDPTTGKDGGLDDDFDVQ